MKLKAYKPKFRYAVDPGVSGTGIAVWKDSDWDKPEALPVLTANLYPSSSCNFWTERVEQIAYKLAALFEQYPPVAVYSEFPEFQGSVKGRAAATKGDLQKLTFIVGVFACMTWNRRAVFYPFDVSTWKGQLPKEIVTKRIIDRLPNIVAELNPVSHSWDAIGIGLHAKGVKLSDN